MTAWEDLNLTVKRRLHSTADRDLNLIIERNFDLTAWRDLNLTVKKNLDVTIDKGLDFTALPFEEISVKNNNIIRTDRLIIFTDMTQIIRKILIQLTIFD